MNIRQVEEFLKDKKDTPCLLTGRLIEASHCRRDRQSFRVEALGRLFYSVVALEVESALANAKEYGVLFAVLFIVVSEKRGHKNSSSSPY